MVRTDYLVDKYSRQAPRYTSYPPAPHFQETDDTDRAISAIRQRNTSRRSISLYVHIPFCASLCWYCACTRVITRKQGDSRIYLDRLFNEMRNMSEHMHSGNRVVQIHFGGGSPTFLTPSEIRETGKRIRSFFNVDEKAEFAFEIDPRRLTPDHVAALAEIGCNRASVGIQDVHDEVQRAIHRIQPMDLNEKVIGWLRDEGIRAINMDLIYGLPYQNRETFRQTIDAVLALDPDRLAVFNYAHVPWMMPSQKLMDRFPMPDAQEKFAILEMMTGHLTHSGYRYIGLDHFAKNEDELSVAQKNGTLQRNFQGYSTRSNSDIYGFGMSSISQIGTMYLQSVKELDRYYERVKEGRPPWFKACYLNRDDEIRRDTIMRLMCDLHLDFEQVASRWNLSFQNYFSEAITHLEEMERDGLVTLAEKNLAVTPTGRLFLRNIATAFDAYYRLSEKKIRYSKTV